MTDDIDFWSQARAFEEVFEPATPMRRWYAAHPGARCSCPDCVKAFPTAEGYCGTHLPFHTRCLRAVTDPCDVCKMFDARKDEWAAAFGELQNAPRVAVPGDIL